MRPDSGGGPIRADPSLAELGNVDVVVLPPILDGLDDSLAAHPDLIMWMKSRAAEDALLMSRKHPQRTRHEGDGGSRSTDTVPRHLAPAGPPSTP